MKQNKENTIKKKKRTAISISAIVILLFSFMTFVAGCDEPGDAVRNPLNTNVNLFDEDTEVKECYLLFKEVENMQGNYDDKKIKDDFYAEIDKRYAAADGKELDEAYKELEGHHVIADDPETYDLLHQKKEYDGDIDYIVTGCFGGVKKATMDTKYDYTEKLYVTEQSEILKKVYPEFTQELTQYKMLLSVIQGTWTRVSKYNSDFSWDDNGPQITLSIVGNHQVQLVRPQLGWVPAPEHKQHQDFAVVGQATDQYTCRMGEPLTDKRYVGKPNMMLSQGGKDIIFIVLNEDNTITFNGAENISIEELDQRFGDEALNKVWLDQTYSKVQ